MEITKITNDDFVIDSDYKRHYIKPNIIMENYEKKYNELVGKMKKAYLYTQTDSTKAVLEDILPELKESEDERIRKELIEHIKSNCETGFVLFQKFSPDDVIAWLEKQGQVKES